MGTPGQINTREHRGQGPRVPPSIREGNVTFHNEWPSQEGKMIYQKSALQNNRQANQDDHTEMQDLPHGPIRMWDDQGA